MKGGVRKKGYSIFLISNFLTLPVIGWIMGGLLPAFIGFIIALIIDVLFPTWKHELSWNDISLALGNIYRYGSNPCELCFIVGNRKVFVYRDERGNEKRPIRMSIRVPIDDWSDLFDKEGFSKLLHTFGGMGFYSKDRGPECYGLFPRGGQDDCKEILKILFEKSVGGLRPDIYARSVVNAKKNIWINHRTESE